MKEVSEQSKISTIIIFFIILSFNLSLSFGVSFLCKINTCYALNYRLFEINAVGGVPQLLGVEGAFVGIPHLAFGVGYGYYPINSFLQKQVHINNVSLGTEFEIIPEVTYTLNTMSGFIRLFPFDSNNSGFFFQIGYAPWKLSAELSADLYSKTLKRTMYNNVITGTGELEEIIWAATIGYHALLTPYIFVIGGIGVARMLMPTYTLNIQGEYLRYMLLIPSLRTEYENAKADVQKELDNKISEFHDKYEYIPSLFVSIGVRW
ncbi:MAG: hypothetical protein HQK49_20180 [Oligoflexia bacterium]|nr:hypothetical protein [Oligoflexia bacterium]